VLQGLNLDVEKGAIHRLHGPAAAPAKPHLLNLLGGLDVPTRGSHQPWHGDEITNMSAGRRYGMARRVTVAFIFQML